MKFEYLDMFVCKSDNRGFRCYVFLSCFFFVMVFLSVFLKKIIWTFLKNPYEFFLRNPYEFFEKSLWTFHCYGFLSSFFFVMVFFILMRWVKNHNKEKTGWKTITIKKSICIFKKVHMVFLKKSLCFLKKIHIVFLQIFF